MINKIVEDLRQRFFENLDEALLLDWNNKFSITEAERNWLKKNFGPYYPFHSNDEEELLINPDADDRNNPQLYLSVKLLQNGMRSRRGSYLGQQRFDDYFDQLFVKYWSEQVRPITSILQNAHHYLEAENILPTDLYFINVGYRDWHLASPNSYSSKKHDWYQVVNGSRAFKFVKQADVKTIEVTYADIFVFSKDRFLKLTLGSDGPIERTPYLYKDIKKLNIADQQRLEIYFHGHFDPESIVFDDYKSAIKMQNHLTDLRARQPNKHHGEQRNHQKR